MSILTFRRVFNHDCFRGFRHFLIRLDSGFLQFFNGVSARFHLFVLRGAIGISNYQVGNSDGAILLIICIQFGRNEC